MCDSKDLGFSRRNLVLPTLGCFRSFEPLAPNWLCCFYLYFKSSNRQWCCTALTTTALSSTTLTSQPDLLLLRFDIIVKLLGKKFVSTPLISTLIRESIKSTMISPRQSSLTHGLQRPNFWKFLVTPLPQPAKKSFLNVSYWAIHGQEWVVLIRVKLKKGWTKFYSIWRSPGCSTTRRFCLRTIRSRTPATPVSLFCRESDRSTTAIIQSWRRTRLAEPLVLPRLWGNSKLSWHHVDIDINKYIWETGGTYRFAQGSDLSCNSTF